MLNELSVHLFRLRQSAEHAQSGVLAGDKKITCKLSNESDTCVEWKSTNSGILKRLNSPL